MQMMQGPAARDPYQQTAPFQVPMPLSGAWGAGPAPPLLPMGVGGSSQTPPSLPSAWLGNFEIVREMPVIGTGSFGTIFHVRDRGNQRTFAVKVIDRRHYEVRGMGKQISTEIKAMQRSNNACSDPGWSRVVQLHGIAEENGFVFLMLELCVHGNLAQQLFNSPAGIKEGAAARCARHLFQGLRDIHAAGIIHRDIKPENLLLTTNGVLKISDFGWAADLCEAPTGFAGTFDTMAPEILKNETHSTAVDMWSAGAVLYHMVTGKKLLRANIGQGATQLSNTDPKAAALKRRNRVLKDIENRCPPSPRSRPKHVSEDCWDLICLLLEPEHRRRPTAEEALQHPWLCGDRDYSQQHSRYGGA